MENEYTTLEFLFYGSETNSFFGTVLHLGLIGVAGYFSGKYIAPVLWDAITKDSKGSKPKGSDSAPRVEKVIYQPAQPQPALATAPVLTYGS